jgi:hypothetical protein
MTDLSLQEAVAAASRVKAGESLPSINISGVDYYPRKSVKYLRGIGDKIENTELVLAKNSKQVGVRNIDKDQLDFPFLVTGARLAFDKAVTTEAALKTALFADEDAPAEWKNGELRFVQDTVLSELPCSVFTPNLVPTSQSDKFYTVSPYLIRPNKAFQIQTNLAGTATAVAFNLEIEGIEFVKNTRTN